jgi:DNA-binding MarR family transcriptional regulator
MTKRDIDVDRLLPLAPAVLHILIALGEGERHGYAVMQEVAERTDGKVRMSPGTLYGSIRKMLDEGLIEELFRRGAPADPRKAGSDPRRTGSDDERRRYYRVTKFGRAVAAAEAERLAALLHHARLTGLVPRKS